MSFLEENYGKNYGQENYKRDLEKLKYCCDQNFMARSNGRESPYSLTSIFDLYNRVSSFYLYYRSRTILSENELQIKSFDSGSTNWKYRTHDELVQFENIDLANFQDGYKYLVNIWSTLGGENKNTFLVNRTSLSLIDLESRRSAFIRIKGVEPSKIPMYLDILRDGYNYNLSVFFEAIAARQALFETYNKLTNFSYFHIGLLQEIMAFDRQIILLMFDLLFFLEDYVCTSKQYLK